MKLGSMKNIDLWEKCEKCGKLKKDSKNHNSKIFDRTEFCLAPSEREKLALF